MQSCNSAVWANNHGFAVSRGEHLTVSLHFHLFDMQFSAQLMQNGSWYLFVFPDYLIGQLLNRHIQRRSAHRLEYALLMELTELG